jgi:hypothetical protein
VKTLATLFFALTLAAVAADKTPAPAAKPASAKPAPLMPVRSAFTQPASVRDGRDPFFPESTRVFEITQAATVHVVELNNLVVKGFSIVRGRPMVIINNHSFMVGDEGDVLVTGGRAHLRCVEILSSKVVVEVNGARHEIKY